jgi:(4S)-4-hydroxy-5-phosphonooxypentane-2,3-dione isomerase
MIIPDRDLEHLKEALQEHIALTRNEVGYIAFEVNQGPKEKTRFNGYEVFTHKQAFELHH